MSFLHKPLKLVGVAITILAFFSLSFPSTAAPKGENLVPKSVAGMKMKYSDLHGNYTYTFASDGTYSWISTRDHEKPDTRKGRYQWKVKGNDKAVLDCGDDEVFTLTFDSPTHARGTVTDDVRVYRFTFGK